MAGRAKKPIGPLKAKIQSTGCAQLAQLEGCQGRLEPQVTLVFKGRAPNLGRKGHQVTQCVEPPKAALTHRSRASLHEWLLGEAAKQKASCFYLYILFLKPPTEVIESVHFSFFILRVNEEGREGRQASQEGCFWAERANKPV